MKEILDDITFCEECPYHGEPNGCNRKEGECKAYNAYLELQAENGELHAQLANAVVMPCKSWDNVYCLRYTEKGYRIEEKIVKEIAFSNGNMEIRTFCGMFSYEKWTFGDDCFTDYNEAVAHRVKGGKQ